MSESELESLPLITEWVDHDDSHGKISYSSGSGLYCPLHNCLVNRNPRDLTPIFDCHDRKSRTSR